MSLSNNITNLQNILNKVNTLPEAGGINLPELTNEGAAVDLVSGKELINSSGEKITGTNPYAKEETDATVETQADLISQIVTTLETKVVPPVETVVLQDNKTVTPTTSVQTVTPDSGYDGLEQVTVNAMPTATQATPSITVSSAGLITASSTQTAGYVAAGTKSTTKQLTTQAAQTITPGTSNKTIASGRYLTGTQTIKGDANLVASNIKSGVSIFGVAGSYEGSGGGSGGSVETCMVIGTEIEGICYYSDGTQIVEDANNLYTGNPVSVAKNSILCCDYFSPLYGAELTLSGDGEILFSNSQSFAVAIYGDCELGYDVSGGPM